MVTYPLDFLRAARMASAADAAKATLGLSGAVRLFSKGLVPEVTKGTLSRVLKFGGFPVAHRLLFGAAPAAGAALTRAAAGALATLPEMVLCTFAARIFRGRVAAPRRRRDVDIPWETRVAAPPRLRRE